MSLHAFLLLGLFLFAMGLTAVLARRNLITILIGVELMLNAASLNFMAFNRFASPDPVVGQVTVLVIIGLAAAEVAIFLSILIALYRVRHDIDAEDLAELKD
jgi:NADH:ubiquinone oxidoreductase subunit K